MPGLQSKSTPIAVEEGMSVVTKHDLLSEPPLTILIGADVQFMHILDRDRCNWLRERIETPEQVCALSFPVISYGDLGFTMRIHSLSP